MTKTPQPVIHVFKEFNEDKYKSVRHYQLQKISEGTTLLSNQINLSLNRNFAQSTPEYWLKIRQDNKWSKCITGLFKTSISDVYKGDVNKKKNLLLFRLSFNEKTLTAYYFLDYHTHDLSKVLPLINE